MSRRKLKSKSRPMTAVKRLSERMGSLHHGQAYRLTLAQDRDKMRLRQLNHSKPSNMSLSRYHWKSFGRLQDPLLGHLSAQATQSVLGRARDCKCWWNTRTGNVLAKKSYQFASVGYLPSRQKIGVLRNGSTTLTKI